MSALLVLVLLVLQVTGQRDGARLLVTLESKQTERLDSALERLQELLRPGAVIDVQQDVSSLSGQSGPKASCSAALSPEKVTLHSRDASSADVAEPVTELKRVSGVWAAASAAGLADGTGPA